MRRNAILAFAISSISLLTVSATGIAQQPDAGQSQQQGMGMMDHDMKGGGMMGQGMMGRGGMMEMMGGGCPMMGMMGGDAGMPSFANGRVAFIKAELAITDAQKGVWDAYSTALGKSIEGMQGMRETMMGAMQAASPVERLDRHITAMEGRLQSLKAVKPVLAALFAALSDDQKKKADGLLTGMGCMM
jgi:hypothetical protein